MKRVIPTGVAVATAAATALIGIVLIQFIITALHGDWTSFTTPGAVTIQWIALSVGLMLNVLTLLIPIWLIRRGSLWAAPIMSLISLWQIALVVVYFDLIGFLACGVSLVGTGAIWLPISRSYLWRVRQDRIARRDRQRVDD